MEKVKRLNDLKPDLKFEVFGFFSKDIKIELKCKVRNLKLTSYFEKYRDLLKQNSDTCLDVNLVGLKKKKDENISIISETLNNYKTLKKLKLIMEHNSLTDHNLITFCSILKELTNLVTFEINLETNQITKEGLKTISETLSFLPNLQFLEIKLKNNIFDSIDEFGKGLTKLTNLRVLKVNIFNKKLKNNFVKSLSNSILHLTSLENLVLDFQQSNDANTSSLNKMLDKLTNLKSFGLNLSSSSKGDKSFQTLNDTLANSRIHFTKFDFDMRNNKLSGKSFKTINVCWKNFNSLTSLNLLLSSNYIDDIGIEYIANGFNMLNNITYLNLDVEKNQITEQGGIIFFSRIHNLEKITTLKLNFNYNKLSSSVCTIYLSNLVYLSHITINLDNNGLDNQSSQYLYNLSSKLSSKIKFEVTLENNSCNLKKISNNV